MFFVVVVFNPKQKILGCLSSTYYFPLSVKRWIRSLFGKLPPGCVADRTISGTPPPHTPLSVRPVGRSPPSSAAAVVGAKTEHHGD